MNKPKIHFRVSKNGDTTILDVHGAGEKCTDVTAGLEKALGMVNEKSREATAAASEPVDPIHLENHNH